MRYCCRSPLRQEDLKWARTRSPARTCTCPARTADGAGNGGVQRIYAPRLVPLFRRPARLLAAYGAVYALWGQLFLLRDPGRMLGCDRSPPLMPLGWLHLSDLHQTVRSHGWLEEPRKRRVCAHLERVHKEIGSVDVVFVTGDLTMRGAPEEFEAVQRSLEQLLDLLRGFGSSPCVLAVPGNHDLARPSDPSIAGLRALRNWSQDPEVRSDFWNDPASPGRCLVDRALQPYGAWWTRLLATMPPKRVREVRTGLLPGDFTATIVKDGMHIGIAGLCSSFLQIISDDHRGRLAVDPVQLRMAAGGDVSDWIMRHDAALLLTHHGPEWLLPNELARYRRFVHPERRFAAHLTAHGHDETVEQQGSRSIVRAHAFFGKEPFEYSTSRDGRRFGYNAGTLARTTDAEKLLLEGSSFIWGGRGAIYKRTRFRLDVARFPRFTKATLGLLERAELRDALHDSYNTAESVRQFLDTAGLKTGLQRPGGAAIDVLHTGLCRAAPAKLRKLVAVAAGESRNVRRIEAAFCALECVLKPHGPPDGHPGTVHQGLLDELYEQLIALQPAMFEAVLALLGIAADIPDVQAPRETRAIAVVRRMQRDSKTVERLSAAILDVLDKRPPSQAPAGIREAGWIALSVLGLLAAATLMAVFAELGKKQADQRRTPTAASVARLLVQMFDDERDFDGFVFVHFSTAYRHFNSGMARDQRIAVLLKHASPAEVVNRIKRANPTKFVKLERLLEYDVA